VKEIIEDITDEEEDEECEEEHHKEKPYLGDNYIDLVTVNQGQDFQLRVKGKDMTACERIFDRLYSKIKKGSMPAKKDASYH
jgi:hypothetical protein